MWLSSNSTIAWSFIILFTSPLSLKKVYPCNLKSKNSLRREYDLWWTWDALTVHYYRLMMEPVRLKSWISISLDVLKDVGFIKTNCDLVTIVTLPFHIFPKLNHFPNHIRNNNLGSNPSWTRLTHPKKVLS